jgi:hypothetical protein
MFPRTFANYQKFQVVYPFKQFLEKTGDNSKDGFSR